MVSLLKHIKSFIQSHSIMVLATVDGDQPHARTVFYVTRDAKTLYFKSYNITQHAKNLKNNAKVSIAMYDKESSAATQKQGIQILGKAARITALEEATQTADLYIATFHASKDKFYPIENLITDNAESSMFRVDIQQVKMLDSTKDIHPETYVNIDSD